MPPDDAAQAQARDELYDQLFGMGIGRADRRQLIAAALRAYGDAQERERAEEHERLMNQERQTRYEIQRRLDIAEAELAEAMRARAEEGGRLSLLAVR